MPVADDSEVLTAPAVTYKVTLADGGGHIADCGFAHRRALSDPQSAIRNPKLRTGVIRVCGYL